MTKKGREKCQSVWSVFSVQSACLRIYGQTWLSAGVHSRGGSELLSVTLLQFVIQVKLHVCMFFFFFCKSVWKYWLSASPPTLANNTGNFGSLLSLYPCSMLKKKGYSSINNDWRYIGDVSFKVFMKKTLIVVNSWKKEIHVK